MILQIQDPRNGALSWQLSYNAPYYHMGKVTRQFVVAIIVRIFIFQTIDGSEHENPEKQSQDIDVSTNLE